MSTHWLFPPAHHNAPAGTSVFAAVKIAPVAPNIRERVFDFIRESGPNGATDDEGEAALGMKSQSYTPRRRELAKSGRVVDSGQRRQTSTGRSAAVWVADDQPSDQLSVQP